MIDKKFFELLDPTNFKLNKEVSMQGGTLQPQAIRETKYAQQIAILHNTIDSLASDLSTLRVRLEPFMSGNIPACSEDRKEEDLPTSINAIREAIQKVIEIKGFVNETLQRLEI